MGKYGDNPDPKEENYERFLAEQIYLKQTAKRDQQRKIEKDSVRQRYSKLVKAITEGRINVDNVFTQSNEKRSLLTDIMGYKRLKIKGDKGVFIEEATNERVGHAAKNIYYSALNYLAKNK